MSIIRYISIILTAAALTSCAIDAEPPGLDNPHLHFVAGRVYDADNNEIEHIKVTIEWGPGHEPSVNFTASDGSFTAEIPEGIQSERFDFRIILEDIDGQENGGLFETMTDKAIYSLDPESPTGFLVYHMNRATASESSPQY